MPVSRGLLCGGHISVGPAIVRRRREAIDFFLFLKGRAILLLLRREVVLTELRRATKLSRVVMSCHRCLSQLLQFLVLSCRDCYSLLWVSNFFKLGLLLRNRLLDCLSPQHLSLKLCLDLLLLCQENVVAASEEFLARKSWQVSEEIIVVVDLHLGQWLCWALARWRSVALLEYFVVRAHYGEYSK